MVVLPCRNRFLHSLRPWAYTIISFRIYDSYFHHDVRVHGAGVTPPRSMRVDLGFFSQFSYRFFPPFLSLSLSSYFPFHWAFIIFLFWLFTETSRAFEERQGQSRFSELNFSSFFRHLKASGVLPVCDSGLILWTYKITVLAHTKKSILRW